MARIPLGDQVAVGKAVANVDAKYGPYVSTQAAFDALGENGDDVLSVGLTIGVTQQDGSIKEYWIKKKAGEKFAATDFVEKSGGGVTDLDVSAENSTTDCIVRVTINNDIQDEVNLPVANVSERGVMTPEMVRVLNALHRTAICDIYTTFNEEKNCFGLSLRNSLGEETGLEELVMPKSIAVPISRFDESQLEGDLKDYNDVYVIED